MSLQFSFFKACFRYLGFLTISYEFEGELFHFLKKGLWDSDRIVIESIDSLDIIVI